MIHCTVLQDGRKVNYFTSSMCQDDSNFIKEMKSLYTHSMGKFTLVFTKDTVTIGEPVIFKTVRLVNSNN